MARNLAATHGAQAIVLSGGVMQNTLLVEMVLKGLSAASVPVLTHKQVPANDGGLAFGQALVALSRSWAIHNN
jgi:hydrogenase maturation protein HypF